MQIIGFNFTKVLAERILEIYKPNISTNIEFTNIDKESINLLKDIESAGVSFKYALSYENTKDEESQKKKIDSKSGELIFEGKIIISIDQEESKNLYKAWKKKELPNSFKVPLFNLILKKCTPRALNYQEELGLPNHIPMPRLERKDQ